MKSVKKINAPFRKSDFKKLSAGDRLFLTGRLVTVRDASLRRIFGGKGGKASPVFASRMVFFAGPAPTPPGKVSGSIGPTTANRMAGFIPALVRSGVLALVGKGDLPLETRELLVENDIPYLVAVGGVAALLARSVVSSRVVAFPELGTEALREIAVRSFPLVVALDSRGSCLFDRFR